MNEELGESNYFCNFPKQSRTLSAAEFDRTHDPVLLSEKLLKRKKEQKKKERRKKKKEEEKKKKKKQRK